MKPFAVDGVPICAIGVRETKHGSDSPAPTPAHVHANGKIYELIEATWRIH